MEQKNIQVEVQGKNVLPTPIKNLRELTTEVTQAGADATEAKELAEVNTEIVADKDYDTAKFSGMGRVNLQKNIVDGHNYLTQEMVSKPNTIYKIQYDYEIAPVTTGYTAQLNQGTIEVEGHTFNYKVIAANAGDIITKESGIGNTTAILYMTSDNVWHNPHTPVLTVEEGWTIAIADVVGGSTAVNYNVTTKSITIPENCVLDFEGGSIRGGTIDFNNAIIIADYNLQIFDDIDFIGLKEMSIKWFGAKGDNITDDTDVFKFILNRKWANVENAVTTNHIIHIPNGIYRISDCINENCFTDTNKCSHQYELIGEGNINVSTLYPLESEYLEEPKGKCSIIRCIGNLNTKPFIYAPALMQDLSIIGDNGTEDTYFTTYAKYSDTVGIFQGHITGCANGRQLKNVGVAYFGIGIKIGSSYGHKWDGVKASRCYYGIIINDDFTATNGFVTSTFNYLTTELNKKTGLYIKVSSSGGVFYFYKLVSQYNNYLRKAPNDYDGYQIYSVSTKAHLYFDYLYVENGDVAQETDVMCVFPPQTLLTFPQLSDGVYKYHNTDDIRYKFFIRNLQEGGTITIDANNCYGLIENSLFTRLLNYKNTDLINTFVSQNSWESDDYNRLEGIIIRDSSYNNLERLITIYQNSVNSPLVKIHSKDALFYKNNANVSIIPLVREVTSVETISNNTVLGSYLYHKAPINKPIFAGVNSYKDALGFTPARRRGSTNNRPTILDGNDGGYMYFDEDLNKMLYWIPTSPGGVGDGKWVEYDYATAGVQRAGLITKRPATSDIPAGFTYVVTASFDIGGTTYNAGVYAYIGSDNWITPDGTTVSDGTLPTRS